jgi:hypothetical protein
VRPTFAIGRCADGRYHAYAHLQGCADVPEGWTVDGRPRRFWHRALIDLYRLWRRFNG